MLGIAIMLSRIVGFAREITLATFHGADIVSDAFILALTIPDSLIVFIGSAVAASFIPMYHRVKKHTNFTRNIMTCVLVIGLAFSIIFTIFPGVLVRLFAFQLEPETFEIAVFFVRYMVWTASFNLLMDVYNAYLEIKGAFFSAGIRVLWRNLVVVIGLVLGYINDYNLIVALSPVVGSALSLFVLSIISRKYGYTYKPQMDINSSDLKQVMALVVPMFFASASGQLNMIVSKNFAATLPVGSISYLNYSSRVAGLFGALFGSTLYTVLYPHISMLAVSNDLTKFKSVLTRGIMYMTAIMLPLSIGLIVLAEPGMRILFERGYFTAIDTVQTASILRMYAGLVLFGSIKPLIVRGFYAVQDTKTPAKISIAGVAVSVLLHYILLDYLGVKGLALATSLAGGLTMLLQMVFLRRKLGCLGLRSNLPEFFKLLLATLSMGGFVWLASDMLPLTAVPVWKSVLLCFVVITLGVAVYGILLLVMKNRLALEAFRSVANLSKVGKLVKLGRFNK